MPFFWNNMMVVTKDELVPAFYNTESTLKNEISRYADKDFGIKKVQKGGNGRQMLIAFDSLTGEIQHAIGDPRKLDNPLELFYKGDVSAAVRYYTEEFRFDDDSRLSLKHQEAYITNASVLHACILLKEAREYERKSKGGSCKGVMSSICRDVIAFNKVLQLKHNTQHSLPYSEKRFKEAFKTFEKIEDGGYNYGSLISGRLRNENAKLVTDDLLFLLNDLFASQSNKPTRTEVARQYEAFLSGYVEVINTVTGEQYEPKEFKPISESTIINYLNRWEDKIGSYLKRTGDRQKYIGQFIPAASLKMPEYSGEIISIDDRQPPFWYAKGERAWFYMGVDIASQAWTVWVHGKSKEGIIVEFYRQLIRNYTEWGFKLPAELECESSLNSMFKNTFLRNGAMFDHVRIEANNARGKYIERMFGKLRYEKEKAKAGWIARPFAKKEDNQKGGADVPIIPYEQIIDNSLRDIENWNNTEHPEHKGMTRWEFFESRQHPALQDTNWMAILPHLGFKTETSCNAGIIRLNNNEFLIADNGVIQTGKRLIDIMKNVEQQKLDVYWLDDNSGKVLRAIVFARGGDTVLCEAMHKPSYSRSRIGRTPEDEKNMALMSKYANTIEAYGRERKNKIEQLLVIDNRPETLNKKFSISGLKRYEVPEEGYETETLPSIEDDEMEDVPVYSHTRSLKNRF